MSLIFKFSHSRVIVFAGWVCLSALIVGCSTATEVPNDVPTKQPTVVSSGVLTVRPPIGLDPTATAPPPAYREPSQPITLDTVPQIAYLGRLDSTGVKSTFFDWAVSPDGIQLVALNNDLLTEWNLVTGRINFNTSRNGATHVLYSADRNEIYAIDVDGAAVVYASIEGDRQTRIELHSDYSGIFDYDVDNGRLAVHGRDNTIKIWDMAERLSLVTLEAQDHTIVDMALSNEVDLLMTAGVDGIVRLWSWESKSQIAEYDLQGAITQDMVFSPNDSQLAIATQNFVAVWDVLAGELDYVLQTGTDSADQILDFSPDGEFLITAGESGNMRLWDAETSDMAVELPGIGGIRVDAAFSTDTTLLATTMLGHEVSLWNIADSSEDGVGRAPLDISSRNLFGVEWSSDGFTLLFFDATGEIFVWGIPADN